MFSQLKPAFIGLVLVIVGLVIALIVVLSGCAATPHRFVETWSEVQTCLSGPDPYSNGIPGGTTYRWMTLPGGTRVSITMLPYWPEGCELFDVELDGDVDMRDVWRLLP